MAKQTFNLVKDVWTQVATGAAVFTVKKEGDGALFFNDVGADVNAHCFNSRPNNQYLENEARTTFVKATGDGWTIIVDGVL